MKLKTIIWSVGVILLILVIAVVGGSVYMLDYSLAPDPERKDTAACFNTLMEDYPETRTWIDSLRRHHALRDTFVTMPSGERHHAYYINKGTRKTALVIHGWRDTAIKFMFLGRIYEQELDYNVVMPDIHAHGLSEGEAIRMGWLDRKDMLHWLSIFQTDTMVVHGVSMGGATTMMLSAETLPSGIRDIHFIDDCGYTSVWDEFKGELKSQFGLPTFPLMYTTSMLCKWRYGWSFQEASALSQVSKSQHPMLFIHGGNDTFVPTEMVYRLYAAKSEPKSLWIAEGAEHALSYKEHKAEYISRVKAFLGQNP